MLTIDNARRSPAAGETLGRLGALSVRLARDLADLRAIQRLRYKVFHEEMAAPAGLLARLTRRDADRFDDICDHLLVEETRGGEGRVVGAYRLLRQEIATRHGGFYTQGEFDVAALVARHPQKRFLELGRSCVLKACRDRRTVELLWQAIWACVRRWRIDAMFGCASFPGADLSAHALALSFLFHRARADAVWSAGAHRGASMNLVSAAAIDERAALRAMPPLVKGYLRLGAMFGEEAAIDRAFNSIDALVILPVERINPRYVDYFGAEADRYGT